ncbi:hypothetical protein [Adhaeribacter soli]|uniref:hypothetical protein n=1 Tax=Adhaeribacter soli TaxID=2607655 RepID=UPI00178329CE|nr:hypothetical protein [Adhaeribacter soli]
MSCFVRNKNIFAKYWNKDVANEIKRIACQAINRDQASNKKATCASYFFLWENSLPSALADGLQALSMILA